MVYLLPMLLLVKLLVCFISWQVLHHLPQPNLAALPGNTYQYYTSLTSLEKPYQTHPW